MKIISIISRMMAYVATALLLPMMLLTVADVFMRFVFNNPIQGTTELTRLMMVCLPLSMAWCALQDRHITVTIVTDLLPLRVQRILIGIGFILGLAILIIAVWQTYLKSIFEMEQQTKASPMILPWPMYPFWWIYLLSLVVMCLALVSLIIRKWKEIFRNEP